MPDFAIRKLEPRDRHDVAELIFVSINHWYQINGKPPIFPEGPHLTDVFYQVYEALDPGCGLVAEHKQTGRLMGSCFYHPRETHVSLGIMNVHPAYFGRGAGRGLLDWIIDFTERRGQPLRLVSSAINLDSFSLYNKAGFTPRCAYQDMFLSVPAGGLGVEVEGRDRVRAVTADDIAAMGKLEFELCGIQREQDYRYLSENADGFWHSAVLSDNNGGLAGFCFSCAHPAMNMIGPCVARSAADALPLIVHHLDQHPGRSPVLLAPVEERELVDAFYAWGARNCELHFAQVYGEHTPCRGISMPTFLPESA